MDFLNNQSKTNQASEEDLIKALEKVELDNELIRKSFKHPDECKYIPYRINNY